MESFCEILSARDIKTRNNRTAEIQSTYAINTVDFSIGLFLCGHGITSLPGVRGFYVSQVLSINVEIDELPWIQKPKKIFNFISALAVCVFIWH